MRPARRSDETGIALITTLLVLMMVSGLMIGFFATITADQRASGIDRDQTQAYAAAHAGLEKMTSDLATLFSTDVSPAVAQINGVAANPPTIPNFSFTAPGGGSGYTLTFTPDVNGNPAPKDPLGSNITSGPYQGFKGIVTEYPITVTARSNSGGSEVRLRRILNTIAVPVFQFGVFSETDLTFYGGDDFDFGGRVHTNGNLFPSVLDGRTLTFRDRITAVGQVARAVFSNGLNVTTNNFDGIVRVPLNVAAGTFRDLQEGEGSVTGMPGAGQTLYGPWFNLSTGTYASNIRNGLTGAKKLDLPLVSQGATPIDLIRRPAQGPPYEHTTNQPVFLQRLFAQASLRILLSDTAADITNLPTVTATAPVALSGDWVASPPNNGTAYGPISAAHPPIALSPGNPSANLTNSPGSNAATIGLGAGGQNFLPILTMGGTNYSCTAKTTAAPWRFTGCFPAIAGAAVPAGTPVTSGSARGITNVALGIGLTYIEVQTQAQLNQFTPVPFWIDNNTNVTTCLGYNYVASPLSYNLTGCTGPGGTSGRPVRTHALSNAGQALIGGFIKIERQAAPIAPAVMGVWTDVTMEILNLGIHGPNIEGAVCYTQSTASAANDSVIRLQRLRNNPSSSGGGAAAPCNTYAVPTAPQLPRAIDYWPLALYDTREGTYREVATTAPMTMGGIMHYVELDVLNLKRWLAGTIGTTGTQAWNNNGYTVYFSDRRTNRNGAVETGEYGFEDVVNILAAGTPNGTLQTGEDVNGRDGLDVYGGLPPTAASSAPPAGAATPYDAAATPITSVSIVAQALINRPVLFRRALKLRNGGIVSGVSSLPTTGLTVASENPVYVQGNYNATTDPAAEPNVPASIMADAVTLLSNNWNDARSFRNPSASGNRDASTTGYRFAVVAGKGLSFPWPSAGSPHYLFGTDGGVGNFLRLLEDWLNTSSSINYRGSIVSLFTSRQATGTFKYTTNQNVYSYSDRNFTFDTDFLTPSLLPPGTPMFRDVNTLTFRQLLRPTQ